ncbi:unnamed protein product [Soboliphyme baturini]|uniref:J domain-containing protein n=1 Tax=Soboliphyme baturini TaxID=241478 RepID=A0A183ILU5_9BILA|nr:unnamed protein product [Soboliphyme baturini]
MNLVGNSCKSGYVLLYGNICCRCSEFDCIRRLQNQAHQTKDFYNVLEISRNANQSDVKSAFYRLSKKYHPDSNCDLDSKTAARKFQEISEAYETLGNSKKRCQYDESLSAGAVAVTFDRSPFRQPPGAGVDTAYMNEFYEFQRRMRMRRSAASMANNHSPPDFEAFHRQYQKHIIKEADEGESAFSSSVASDWTQTGQHRARMAAYRREMFHPMLIEDLAGDLVNAVNVEFSIIIIVNLEPRQRKEKNLP